MSAIESGPAAAEPVAAEPSAAAAAERWSRWSDRLNPILVREVQQAVKGRAFALTVFLALAIGVIIAISAAGEQQRHGTGGRSAFDAGLATLAPLLLFVVPMGAFQSMRLELRGGIVEQLLLSELRPWRIITGKLAAALVQFVLYVAVLAPLLATSYLLRGVDLPTIGLSLLLALLACIAATSFAISSAAQGLLPGLQALTNLAVAFGLGMASVGAVGYIGSGEYVRDLGWLIRSRELGMTMSLMALGGLAGAVLSGLVAQSFLAHAFENRSSGFRIFLFFMLALAFGWMAVFVDAAHWSDVAPAITFFLILFGAVFGLFMVTEQRALSPRVHAHVPAGRLTALLVAPFLPGRDRGMACLLLYLAVVAATAQWCWPTPAPGHFLNGVTRMIWFAAAYVMIYLAIGKWLRNALPLPVAGSHLARILTPLLVLVFSVAPVLFDVMLGGGVRHWHVGHIMDPFFTIAENAFASEADGVLVVMLWVAGAAVLLQVPGVLRGVREVLAAAAVRRSQPRQAAGSR